MQNKISFITSLLNSKKIDTSQKERILMLTKKELDSIGNSNELINIKIAALENKIEAIQSSSANSFSEDKIYLKIDEYLMKNNHMNENDDFQDFINQAMEADEAMIDAAIEKHEAEEEMIQQYVDAEEIMIQTAIDQQEAEEEMMQQHIDAEDAIIDAAMEQREAEEDMMQQYIETDEIMIQTAFEQQEVEDEMILQHNNAEDIIVKAAIEKLKAEEAKIAAAIAVHEADQANNQQQIQAEGVISGFEVNNRKMEKFSKEHLASLYQKIRDLNNNLDELNRKRKLLHPDAQLNQKKSEGYMSPKDLKDFLIEYNQNEVLKYTCHLIDGDALIKINSLTKTEEYDYQKHSKIISKSFYNLTKNYKEKINKNIHGLIGEYLNNYNKKGWSSDNIKITWSSPELLEWAKLNPGKCPNPDPTLNSIPFNFQPFKINNQQTRIQNFNDLVLHFKSLFHIRRDNSLKAAIDLVNNNYFSEIDDIDCSAIRENIEFFTDIDKVKQVYKKIIEMCNEYHNKINPTVKPVFRLSLKEENDTIIFSIHHKNSIFGKTSKNTISREGEKTTKLMNLINGVCDLFLKADFGNEDYAEINMWNGLNKEINKLESFEGVQFDLIFYR